MPLPAKGLRTVYMRPLTADNQWAIHKLTSKMAAIAKHSFPCGQYWKQIAFYWQIKLSWLTHTYVQTLLFFARKNSHHLVLFKEKNRRKSLTHTPDFGGISPCLAYGALCIRLGAKSLLWTNTHQTPSKLSKNAPFPANVWTLVI